MKPFNDRAPRRHVIVLGIDGTGFDALRLANTPNIDAIAAAGFLTPVRVNPAMPTISAPIWSTMLTGVLAPQLSIFGNNMAGHRLADHPDFLARVRQVLPGSRTYAAATWSPLVTSTWGGPIIRGGGYIPDDPPDLADWWSFEDQLAVDACRALANEHLVASFVYQLEPDSYGHAHGVGPEYISAIERCDVRVGRIMAAITGRPTYSEEHWTVIVATDHGHLAAGGHGGDSDEERTAWIAAMGPDIPTTPPAALEQADVHAQVLTALGAQVDPAWGLFGVPFGLRTPVGRA
jgi:predicted AlkP superfamily pyrophosphatase or phosphodiesterase